MFMLSLKEQLTTGHVLEQFTVYSACFVDNVLRKSSKRAILQGNGGTENRQVE